MVQDPQDAEVPSMPQNALQAVEVDYQVTVAEMSALLTKLTPEIVNEVKEQNMKENKKTSLEVSIACKTTHWNRAYFS